MRTSVDAPIQPPAEIVEEPVVQESQPAEPAPATDTANEANEEEKVDEAEPA